MQAAALRKSLSARRRSVFCSILPFAIVTLLVVSAWTVTVIVMIGSESILSAFSHADASKLSGLKLNQHRDPTWSASAASGRDSDAGLNGGQLKGSPTTNRAKGSNRSTPTHHQRHRDAPTGSPTKRPKPSRRSSPANATPELPTTKFSPPKLPPLQMSLPKMPSPKMPSPKIPTQKMSSPDMPTSKTPALLLPAQQLPPAAVVVQDDVDACEAELREEVSVWAYLSTHHSSPCCTVQCTLIIAALRFLAGPCRPQLGPTLLSAHRFNGLCSSAPPHRPTLPPQLLASPALHPDRRPIGANAGPTAGTEQ